MRFNVLIGSLDFLSFVISKTDDFDFVFYGIVNSNF